MKENFLGHIYINFKKNQGWLLSTIALGVSILLWIFKPGDTISLGLFLSLLIVLFFLTFIFIDSGYEIFCKYTDLQSKYSDLENKNYNPKLIEVIEDDGKILVIAKPSKLFYNDMMVSLYYTREMMENLIGVGNVDIITDQGIIQVEMIHLVPRFEDINSKMIANNSKILKNTVLKPYVPKKELYSLIKGDGLDA